MIYPPSGETQTPEASRRGRDPDRQLALMLVVLAMATALVFYAAELGPAGLARFLGIDSYMGRYVGAAATVTATIAAGVMEPAVDPTVGMPTPNFAGFPTVVLWTPTAPATVAEPVLTPIMGSAWPTLDTDVTYTAEPITRTPTADRGTGYPSPGSTPSNGYPAPARGSASPTSERSSSLDPTPSPDPGES